MSRKNSKEFSERMRAEIRSRCSSIKYALKFCSLFNKEGDFNTFISELLFQRLKDEVEELSRDNPKGKLYRARLSNVSVRDILENQNTFEILSEKVEKILEGLSDDEMLDVILNNNLEGSVDI